MNFRFSERRKATLQPFGQKPHWATNKIFSQIFGTFPQGLSGQLSVFIHWRFHSTQGLLLCHESLWLFHTVRSCAGARRGTWCVDLNEAAVKKPSDSKIPWLISLHSSLCKKHSNILLKNRPEFQKELLRWIRMINSIFLYHKFNFLSIRSHYIHSQTRFACSHFNPDIQQI